MKIMKNIFFHKIDIKIADFLFNVFYKRNMKTNIFSNQLKLRKWEKKYIFSRAKIDPYVLVYLKINEMLISHFSNRIVVFEHVNNFQSLEKLLRLGK